MYRENALAIEQIVPRQRLKRATEALLDAVHVMNWPCPSSITYPAWHGYRSILAETYADYYPCCEPARIVISNFRLLWPTLRWWERFYVRARLANQRIIHGNDEPKLFMPLPWHPPCPHFVATSGNGRHYSTTWQRGPLPKVRIP
jgi:hypothetical protein